MYARLSVRSWGQYQRAKPSVVLYISSGDRSYVSGLLSIYMASRLDFEREGSTVESLNSTQPIFR